MKKLTYEEFESRMVEVSKARDIFIPHITKNISVAFQLYQDVLAEEQQEVFLSTMVLGDKPISPLDEYERPECPECKNPLLMKIRPKDEDGKEWETSWYCDKCLSEFYSNKTVKEWMNELTRKD